MGERIRRIMASEHKILCLSLAPGYHILWSRGRAAKLSKGYVGNFRSFASSGGGEGGLAVLSQRIRHLVCPRRVPVRRVIGALQPNRRESTPSRSSFPLK